VRALAKGTSAQGTPTRRIQRIGRNPLRIRRAEAFLSAPLPAPLPAPGEQAPHPLPHTLARAPRCPHPLLRKPARRHRLGTGPMDWPGGRRLRPAATAVAPTSAGGGMMMTSWRAPLLFARGVPAMAARGLVKMGGKEMEDKEEEEWGICPVPTGMILGLAGRK